MKSQIIFDPLLPLWALGFVITSAIIVALVFIWRSPQSGIFRTLALASMLAVLFNPQLQTNDESPLDDIVLVLIDQSMSQTLDNRIAVSRQISNALNQRLNQLENIEVREIPIEGTQETLILDALRSALADAPRAQLAALFLVTDGQASDIPLNENNEAQLGNMGGLIPAHMPLHVLLTGRENETDRRIKLLNAPRYGIVRESVRVSFRVEDIGPNEKPLDIQQNVPVSLKVDGVEILNQAVPVGQNVGFDVPLDRPGQLIIELSAATKQGELSPLNNTAVLPITAVRDRLRVLLISGEPNPGERVWRNLLKSDPSIDLVHFTILRTADKFDSASSNELALIPFPTNELFIEKLKEFDLIIFDRYTWRNVLKSYHFDNIARFVEEGGAMLVASGPEYNGRLSLARRRTISWLLPALPKTGTIDKAFRPALTQAGRRHPVTANLPEQGFWGRWLRTIPTTLKTGISLLSGADDHPILILDRIGEGRIGMIQSDHIWLWSRGFDGGGPHAELLRRTAHWLMKEPQLEEERLSLTADKNNLIIERRTLSDSPSATTLTLPDGTQRLVEMQKADTGAFRAVISDLPPGLYRASADELFAVGAIGLAGAPELKNIVSDQRKVLPLVQQSGGGIFAPRQTSETIKLPAIRPLTFNGQSSNDEQKTRAGPGWAGITRNHSVQIEGTHARALTSPWVWLFLIALMIGLAWALESRPAAQLKKI